MKERCIAPAIEHEWDWIIAAHGCQVFQCKLCGLYWDEYEEGTP